MNDHNILLISDVDISSIANDIWVQRNATFASLKTDNYRSVNFCNSIKDKPNITTITPDSILGNTINVFLNFCEKYNYIPVSIIKNRKSLAHTIYLAIEEALPDAIEYTLNNDADAYTNFLSIIGEL